jgi:OFA family oxalate/formate antiporter-like MFS transporter
VVICAGLIFFTWGEISSLFPALCTDTFGPKFAAANTSCLYTAKGTAALLVPLANPSTKAELPLGGMTHRSFRCGLRMFF